MLLTKQLESGSGLMPRQNPASESIICFNWGSFLRFTHSTDQELKIQRISVFILKKDLACHFDLYS